MLYFRISELYNGNKIILRYYHVYANEYFLKTD